LENGEFCAFYIDDEYVDVGDVVGCEETGPFSARDGYEFIV